MIPEQRFGPGGSAPWADLSQDGRPRTALPVHRGQPRHLVPHLARLRSGAALLGHPAPWLEPLQGDLCRWLERSLPEEDAALRLVLYPEHAFVLARLEPLPRPPSPCRLVPLPHPMKEGRSDPRAPHKGLLGPWGSAVLKAAHQLGADDALLLWPDGTLAETAIAAVGLELKGTFQLPPTEGRVASLAERLDLPDWASQRGLRIDVAPLPLSQVPNGHLWCLNALRGIWPAILV